MNVYYNSGGVGDVLLIPLKEADKQNRTHQVHGDVVRITDETDGTVLGYNIFRASEHFGEVGHGRIRMTEEMLDVLRNLFTKEEITDTLDFDLEHKFVVGYVEEKSPHENADKLSVCQVNLGDSTTQIVCGAPNVDAGQKVVVAKVGAEMPSGMKIKDAELRGVPSSGMICSAKELKLPDAPEEKGILVLDDSYETGEAFHF
ncbi:DUF4479 domain-containing protein [Salimicrobium sp. PL1-032A]|uniref:YtpR family tRNA-binding protein n=1 Tax=Salimicrobium sp. PL1-032A TaxID=3095364 RepID=UPI00325FE366